MVCSQNSPAIRESIFIIYFCVVHRRRSSLALLYIQVVAQITLRQLTLNDMLILRRSHRRLARRNQQLLSVQVQVLIGDEIIHGLVEVLHRAVLRIHAAADSLNLDIVKLLLRHVVRIDLFREADVIAHD